MSHSHPAWSLQGSRILLRVVIFSQSRRATDSHGSRPWGSVGVSLPLGMSPWDRALLRDAVIEFALSMLLWFFISLGAPLCLFTPPAQLGPEDLSLFSAAEALKHTYKQGGRRSGSPADCTPCLPLVQRHARAQLSSTGWSTLCSQGTGILSRATATSIFLTKTLAQVPLGYSF